MISSALRNEDGWDRSGTTACIFSKRSQLGAHYFLEYLFQLLYMFRATMCPSSGELTASMRHWYFSLCMGDCPACRPDSQRDQLPETCREVEINVLRSNVHLVRFIWKRLYRYARSTKHKILHASFTSAVDGSQLHASAAAPFGKETQYSTFETWWHSRRNQIWSFSETDESV